MQVVCGKTQLLHALAAKVSAPSEPQWFRTGLEPLDDLAPPNGFRRGAVHELLWEPRTPQPRTPALLLARAATKTPNPSAKESAASVIVWSDPQRQLYPPALMAMGIDLHRLILLRPRNRAEELWAVAECLRCPGVGATVASIDRLNQVEARRLQLAAETGGGAGLFLRPATSQPHKNPDHCGGAGGGAAAVIGVFPNAQPGCAAPVSSHPSPRASAARRVRSDAGRNRGGGDCYAAATRWLIRPAPAAATAQRWEIQLVHGHGGRVGESVLLEVNHETGITTALRPPAPLVDRPPAAPSARVTA
jgi:hypothetical protein